MASRLRGFGRNEDGSLIIFSLIMFIMMLVFAGMAIDIMRFETQRTTLQNTVDRAVLAAADLDNSADATEVVLDYFDKAGLGEYLDADDVTVLNSVAAGSLSYRRVSALARANVDTMFLNMTGIDSIEAAAFGAAEEGITNLEVSLILDVSGSMGNSSSTGRSKIYELREAAKDFVYFIQCHPDRSRGTYDASSGEEECSVDPGKVSVSLIPYSEQVVGSERLLDALNVSTEHNYSHCLIFRGDDFTELAMSDITPLDRAGHFDRYSSNRSRVQDNDPDLICQTDDDWRTVRPFVEDHEEAIGYIDQLSAGGWTSIDLAAKWGTLLLDPSVQSAVDELTASIDDEGSPVTPLIDPAFRGRPYDYGTENGMKVLVLMTDGQNTKLHLLKDAYRDGPSGVYENTSTDEIYSVYHPGRDADGDPAYVYVDDDGDNINYNGSTWHETPFGDGTDITETRVCVRWYNPWWSWRRYCSEYETTVETVEQPGDARELSFPELFARFPTEWYDRYSWHDTPWTVDQYETKDAQLRNICDEAKDEDVVIYSIGFETDGIDAAEAVLSYCATTPNHFFSADGTNLAEVFGTIATSINQLRLTQ
ncbi:TadE/TadG family type IV pilus assembly protein [Rhodovulum iodosum]|nr:TadE/TadG family type IV pilus assembly protein [Rhodovulum robiginosum]